MTHDAAGPSVASAGSGENYPAKPDGWIAVAERLPEEYATVLVATNGCVSAGEIRFPGIEDGLPEPWWMVFKDRRDGGIAWAGIVAFSNVTHWRPLPEPPAHGTV